MKHILIALLVLTNIHSFSQASKFKTIGITFQRYVKPQSAYGFTSVALWGTSLEKENSFDNVKNNVGVSVYYSQSNFRNNSGIEYGIGLNLMSINNQYSLSLLDSNYDAFMYDLSAIRTYVTTISAPVYYVHKFKLNDKFMLYPKIGLATNLFVHGERISLGQNTDTGGVLSYDVSYTTHNDHFQVRLADFIFTGALGTSIHWELNNGQTVGVDFMFNKQLFGNSIFSKIERIIYEEDGIIIHDSENTYNDHYINEEGEVVVVNASVGSHFAKHSLSNFSIGIKYNFVK